jgi:hypothetical protein
MPRARRGGIVGGEAERDRVASRRAAGAMVAARGREHLGLELAHCLLALFQKRRRAME